MTTIAPSKSSQSPPRPQIINSADLLKGQCELWIEHEGEMYRLRVTKTGKLLLKK